MALTREAKKLLAETIRGTPQAPARGLRHRLLEAIRAEAAGRYRLSVPLDRAGLDEAHRRRRERLEAYLDQRARATGSKTAAERAKARERLLREAEKEAAATLLNRLVTLRLLEARGLSRPAVVTGGRNSRGYREFQGFAPGLLEDDTEGYGYLLRLVFADLAVELPGVFGDVGVTALFPIPAQALLAAVEALDDPALASAWTDDVTLGWVYQYWNDPDREGLDAKLSAGGKILPNEIASKTQMFTERYMVEWLLQNSLGLTWLCMCKKHGWVPEAERVFSALDARRAEWRAKREAGAVPLDALMPIEGALEERWKYYVPQPLPEDAVARAPEAVSAIRLLDPACGSGHFLVIAFDLLAALYQEEARHRGTEIGDEEIAEAILEHNLHGIDIDPRAVQIAAASLYVKARSFAKGARPRRLNLVAPALQLGNLPKDDPAVVELRADLKREAGIPEALTNQLLSALSGVDYLGTLLKVDAAVEQALARAELELEGTRTQGNLFHGFPAQQVKLTLGEAKATVLDRLERFLGRHGGAEDLGLRLGGEQLAAGVRFVRLAREGAYDVVAGNPPYQGLSKTERFGYVAEHYPKGKADLYAAFLERGLELVRPGGVSAMVTMRGWMFIKQFEELRTSLLRTADLRALADLDAGAFEEISGGIVSVVCTAILRLPPRHTAVALRPTPVQDRTSTGIAARKRAGLLAQVGRYEFDPRGFEVIEGEPIVYWWSEEFLRKYAEADKLVQQAPARFGLTTGDNTRFVRLWHELLYSPPLSWRAPLRSLRRRPWVPFVLGNQGISWIEPLRTTCRWEANGLEVKEKCVSQYGTVSKQVRNEDVYFARGIAFAMIGAHFSSRAHRYPSVIGNMGSSVYPEANRFAHMLCLMNSEAARATLQSLNPGIHFEVGDVNRLPVSPIPSAASVVVGIEGAFTVHESTREPSVEFKRPGPSPWRYAQDWAQRAVDRPEGTPLPPYEPGYDPPEPESFVSFAVGVALGRFDAGGGGVLAEAPASALPGGILFLAEEGEDSLDSPACAPLLAAWNEHAAAIGKRADLRDYLRLEFFAHHKKLYENRPIYFPLASSRKSFVALVSIHRWAADTLGVLLADHLVPTARRLGDELDTLRTAKTAEQSRANRARAERRFTEVQRLLEELRDLIAKVTELAERGPPKPDDKTQEREADARFVMDLDDGVLVNSAALWPALEPLWKDPKKWWKQLANPAGKKDYDWAHLAARYFPARVRQKCHEDPSLAVAHGCFWELHPAKAYAWELRLQDEIAPDFTLDEPGAAAARARFLAEHAAEAAELVAAEERRRARKATKEDGPDGPLFEGADGDAPEDEPDDDAEDADD